MPDDFELPEDVPGYPAAELVSVSQDESDALALTLRSADDPDTVADHYFIELRKKNWVVTQTPDPDGQAVWAEKGSRSLTVMISRRPRGSEITLLAFSLTP